MSRNNPTNGTNERATFQLRWVETDDDDEGAKITITDYSHYHLKLQQLWVAEDGTKIWRDVPIVWSANL